MGDMTSVNFYSGKTEGKTYIDGRIIVRHMLKKQNELD
jgi:hypothetical protein